MGFPVAPPRLPDPPQQITQEYMREFKRVLDAYFFSVFNSYTLNVTSVNFVNLPGSGYGIGPGGVWNNNGVLSIVTTPPYHYPSGAQGTTAVGKVTVVIV
jgi:hypothetical protein